MKENRSDRRDRDTFATVLFSFRSVLRRFWNNLTEPFYFYLSRTCGSRAVLSR